MSLAPWPSDAVTLTVLVPAAVGVPEITPDGLIAMCSHGRSGVKRWVLGSVTENVVRHSDAPVLVVRAKQ